MKDSISRTLRWLRRFRHRQGYGIHSPFAFNLVTGVIYESGAYYAYPALKELFQRQPRALRWKDYKLLFRLANFQRPERAWLVGIAPESIVHHCLRAGSQHTDYRFASRPTEPPSAEAALIVAAGDWEQTVPHLLPSLSQGGLLIVIGLNTRSRRAAWKALLKQPQAQVSFDLYDFGLLFYRPELQREHYVINYR